MYKIKKCTNNENYILELHGRYKFFLKNILIEYMENLKNLAMLIV